ncbi:hypothetical protein F383_31408 [Gossypium arboreum]|uniref:Uncharacterized protein n=1 Tax=Gossypium arboreum TaxID=29729 RepID=A0A0B0PGX5_GOSAR|nr:hypothetical protein F383_31408 [Gossypium arboreum]
MAKTIFTRASHMPMWQPVSISLPVSQACKKKANF